MTALRVAMAQLNPCVGDLAGNAALILDATRRAVAVGADIVVMPEMALTGYPVEDLALRPAFRAASTDGVVELAAELDRAGAGGALVVVGYVADDGPRIRNAAAVLHEGRVAARVFKHYLPNYGVFDENRWFAPGEQAVSLAWRGLRIGVTICEDIWKDGGPVSALARSGIDLLLVPNASPYEQAKDAQRLAVIRRRAAEARCPIVFANMTGGQDDLVFDGQSYAVAAAGEILAHGPAFTPDVVTVDLELPARERAGGAADVTLVEVPTNAAEADRAPLMAAVAAPLPPEAEAWQALVAGLRDYTDKIGFPSVILGLSGGIDSAVVAAVAVDALGPSRVYGVSMPSVYSSEHSRDDAADLARRTGLQYRVEPIADMVAAFTKQLGLTGLAEENVQARCRGVILMGLANAEGHLVLATGNKSELACGYSTIYGDAVGGFAPLKDVYKTLVWRMARWRNAQAVADGTVAPVPENSIEKPPSAELRPGQLDSDSLPDYQVLDAILAQYVDHDVSAADLVAQGFEEATVARVVRLVDRAEWKRRQYPPGTKITGKAFGRDRRLPITNRWNLG